VVGSDPITPPSRATAEPSSTQVGVTEENYWNRIEECLALAKAAPTNELRAKHFAAAHRYLQLAEAQVSSETKPAPK
jgi:hypothetical protein